MNGRARLISRKVLVVPSILAFGVVPITDPATAAGTGANGVVSGPIVESSRSEADIGQRTVLTIDGFASPYVQMSICGNAARRGSSDCNMAASQAVEVHGDAPLRIEMLISKPPMPCPCVVRVTGKDVSEVALADIHINGVPEAPLEDPPVIGDVVAVSITAKESPQGALDAIRSALGGKTTYQVTVRVKNLATTPLKSVQLSASAGRGTADDSLVSLELGNPGLLAVGQTWQQTENVAVPAPVFGSTEWRAAVSGAGPTVLATSSTVHRPWLLIVFAGLVVFNIGLVLIRWRMRRHAAREARSVEMDAGQRLPSFVGDSPVQHDDDLDLVSSSVIGD